MREKIHQQRVFVTQHIDTDYEIHHYLDEMKGDIPPASHNFYPTHSHSFYEIYFLVSGSVTYQVQNTFFQLNTGDVLLFNVDQPHCPIFKKNDQRYERIVLRVSPHILEELSSEETDLCALYHQSILGLLRFDPAQRNNIRLILGKLQEVQDQNGFGSDLLYKAYLVELFVILNRFSQVAPRKDEVIGSHTKKGQMIEIINHYIEQNWEKPLRVDDLCEQVYLSKYYFMRFFKEMTGISVYHYIIQKRLMGTISLMEEGIPITSACLQCGFGDYSCFFRAFKKQFGIPPAQYLEISKEDAANMPM